jgi:SAM-dependent methyltransferase
LYAAGLSSRRVTAACPACGGDLLPWRSAPASEPGVGDVALLRCVACGSAVTDAPAAPELYESGDYAPGPPRGARLAAPLLALFDAQRLRFVAEVAPAPARLVDAGAGRGRFVAHARARGYDATGFEPSLRGVAGARDTYGVDLERADIDAATVDDADVVSLWHVLEHLEDPGAALARVHSWLRPGGGIVVGVPNLGSLQALAGGSRWFHLDLPRHRTHFTVAGLRALLARTGYDVVAVHHVLAEHNPFGLWQSAVSRATARPSYLFHLLKRNAPWRSRDLAVSLLALPLVPLAVLVELGAGLARRGGTVAVTARAVPAEAAARAPRPTP